MSSEIFQLLWVILKQILPLYVLIAIGFVAKRQLGLDGRGFARIIIYVLTPAVVFFSVASHHFQWQLIFLPVLMFSMSSLIALGVYFGGRKRVGAPRINLLALMAGTGNTGYFGIPVTLFLFGGEAMTVAVFCAFGFMIFESTIGFYLAAKGNHSAGDSLTKVLKLPTLYVFFGALALSIYKVKFSNPLINVFEAFRGAYVIMGMMMIGVGLADCKFKDLDWTFLGISFFNRFIVWPLASILFILLDQRYFGIFNSTFYPVLFLMGVVPLAANGVAFASALRLDASMTALSVLASTLLALLTIPIAMLWAKAFLF